MTGSEGASAGGVRGFSAAQGNGNLHARVLEQLGLSICGGELPSGTLLSVDELTSRFRVSRSVVREALRVLASMGMVSATRGVGTVTLGRSNWNAFDPAVVRWQLATGNRAAQLNSLVELRAAVEPVAAGLAARRASPSDAAELVATASHLAEAAQLGHGTAFLTRDIEFHTRLLAMSGNEMFSKLHSLVAGVLIGRSEYGLVPPMPEEAAVRLHLDLAVAVQRHEADRARLLAQELVGRSGDELAELLSGDAT